MINTFSAAVALVAFLGVFASAVPLDNEITDDKKVFSMPIKNIAKCAEEGGITGVINCAAMRALKSLQQISKQQDIEVFPGFTLNGGDVNTDRSGKELTDETLPVDPQEKAQKLFDLLVESTARVFSGRTLKVKIPDEVAETVSRKLGDKRKKNKKDMLSSLVMGLGAKLFAIIPVLMAGVGLLAGKAFIVAKLALIVSAIVFFQNFMSNRGSGQSLFSGFGSGWNTGSGGSYGGYGGGSSYTPNTWTTNTLGGSGGSYPYARSIDVAEEAQKLAYAKLIKQE